MEITFRHSVHKRFYDEMVAKTGCHGDAYRKAFFYTLGIMEETRRNICDCYNFKHNWVEFDWRTAGWQTSTSYKMCRLAFNLYNGYCGADQDLEGDYTPEAIFCCELQKYMFEAIKIRYPEYYE